MSATHKTRLKHLKTIGFVVKHHHPEAAALTVELAQILLKGKKRVLFADESKVLAKDLKGLIGKKAGSSMIQVVKKPELVKHCDLIIVLGGDGTFLSIARLMDKKSVPVVGINMGQLGFLTETKRTEAFDAINQILEGAPVLISERSLLEVTLKRKNQVIFQGPVVNDAVISKGAIARIIGMQIAIDGKMVSSFRADGIIVSTPTGSTAYSLAAGGPIVEPALNALVLAPICPHSLTQRPLVVSDDSEIQIWLQHRPGHVFLTLDGQDAVNMLEDDVVIVRKFKKHSLRLISSPTRDYFSLLREKLKFGFRD